MDNYRILQEINNIILIKKFENFYKKYNNINYKNLKELFLKEFNIENNISEEYALFLDYLIKNKYEFNNKIN